MKTRTAWLGLLGAILWAPVGAPGQELTYDGSLRYSTGEYYFVERTSSAYLANGLSVETGRLRFSADLPLIWQGTSWVSHAAGRAVPTGGTEQGQVEDGLRRRGGDGRLALRDTARYDDLGVGDPTFRVEAALTRPGSSTWRVALGAGMKPPLADPERGFGTGAWDAGVDLSVARRLGSIFVFADAGYWTLGNMDAIELLDPVTYAAGIGHTLPGGTVGLLASVSGSSRILEGTDPPLEAGAGVSFRLSPRRSLSASVAVGLTESSPDVSLAAGWSVEL